MPKFPSCGGNGTLEILEIITRLEPQMSCCLVGTSALIYYGANRVRGDWLICVPTPDFETALALLRDVGDGSRSCPFTEQETDLQPYSLMHTFPRFKFNEYELYFRIVSSRCCHIDCSQQNIQYSSNRLPYPKLDVFMQSLVDTNDQVALCDAIDGTNVDDSWAESNLELTGNNDIAWAEEQNELLRNSRKQDILQGGMVATQVLARQEIWQSAINGKEHRLGYKYPKSICATRFRLHGDVDPWLQDREVA